MDTQVAGSSMDTSPTNAQTTSGGISQAFASLASPLSGISHLPNSSSHIMHTPVFPDKDDLSNIMAPMHVPSDLTTSVDMVLMDALAASPSVTTAPTFIPDFPSQCDAFGMGSRIESGMALESPPSNPSSASPELQDASPSIHDSTSGYSVGVSSLAAALDSGSVTVGRSRASSSASPGNLMSSIAGFTFNSPPGSAGSSGLTFPPLDYLNGLQAPTQASPESSVDSHVFALNTMLTSIAKTAFSAREACTMGQNGQVGVKIDELQRAISTVAAMFAPLSLSDQPSPRQYPLVPMVVGASVSPPTTTRVSPERTSVFGGSPSSSAEPMDVRGNLDVIDLSRKRCASATPGDRVNKALKREPKDDVPLSTILSSSIYPTNGVEAGPLDAPISAPTSRPPSPSSLPASNFSNLLQHQNMAHSNTTLSHSISSTPSIPEYGPSPPTTMQSPPPFSMGRRNRSSWSDPSLFARQHQHTLSGSALNPSLVPLAGPSSHPYNTTPIAFPPPTLSPTRTATSTGTTISPPLGRISRSGSVTTGNPFAFVAPVASGIPSMESNDFTSRPSTSKPSPDSDDEDDDEDHEGRSGLMSSRSSENGTVTVTGHGNEVPLEYRDEVDRIFFEFLNKICSNLEATDSKGEPIHQTLMAKKMQRLDESPDFRPFKFRIAAFTNAFLEELARQGYPEEKIPMKKIRNYLWKQSHIQRFNEDGKKAKSKGNHIWNIDAKKADGKWEFRPFHRKLAGSPPGVAYVGLRWSWTPRIWDPQASSTNLPVHYSSPQLPSWLSWKEDVLSGIPPPEAESCEVRADAKFMQDGVENVLSLTFQLHIAPMSSIDTSFSSSRRPSTASEIQSPRRATNENMPPQPKTRSPSLVRPDLTQRPTHQSAQVMQVLTSAAQRVAQEAQSQAIASMAPEPSGPELATQEAHFQALAKQQHVLSLAASDVETITAHQEGMPPPGGSSVLAVAAQQVVLQAARSVRADRSAAAGVPPSPSQQVTVNEVSVATQSAVAQAVEITGPLSSEVDVLMTASSILQHQARAPVNPPVGVTIPKTFPIPGSGLVTPVSAPYSAFPPLPEYTTPP